MSEDTSEREIYEQARKRVEEKKGFFVHLLTYIVVNSALVIIWLMTDPGGYPWFIWPLFGWGIGLVFHFLGVWVFDRKTDWERREIEKEAARLRKESRPQN
ncbi:2TM domain-containing protein [Dehalogenimonas alkenigignens]|uniref:2TM domain n=1 Tax=Dehalogenimonas alkenigignens TaxID=1217799 RepID=A0A0W0GG30_9CHLR|nr:2TM domain-containing protein [Dehalogenimonas alkenigignens]KTB47505.1 2TM domain [Dehalogenimonas alkenigignens]PVV83437.1 hypothetical protein DD509_06280 [Dehalogenimonas alkenigignens]